MNNLYKSPESKLPTWIGWVFGGTFSAIILMSGVVAVRHLDLGPALAASAAGSLASAPAPVAAAPAVAAAPVADEAAPTVAAAADEAPAVAAAPKQTKAKAKLRGKTKRTSNKSFASLGKNNKGKGKPTKVAYLSDSRRKQILAKHDTSASRASKQKLDRLLGL